MKSTLIRPADTHERETVLQRPRKLTSHGFQLRYFTQRRFSPYSTAAVGARHPRRRRYYDPSHDINVNGNRPGLDRRSQPPSGWRVLSGSLLLGEDSSQLETLKPPKLRGGCYRSPAEVQTLGRHGNLTLCSHWVDTQMHRSFQNKNEVIDVAFTRQRLSG